MGKERCYNLRYDKVFAELPIIVKAWYNRSLWLDDPNPPEAMFFPSGIEEGSLLHFHYLYFAAFVSGSGKTANQVIKAAGQIARDYPEYIDPKSVLFHNTPHAIETIRKAVPFTGEDTALGWFFNLRQIRERYDGNLANLLYDIDPGWTKESIFQERQRLISRLDDLWGFGHKKAQLAILWFQIVNWSGNKRLTKIRRIPVIPIDVHAMRLVRQLDWVDDFYSDDWDKVAEPLSEDLCGIMYDLGYNYRKSHDVAQCAWHIQARVCNCFRRCKSAVAARKRCVERCPMLQSCIGLVPTLGRELRHRRTLNWINRTYHPPTDVQIKLPIDVAASPKKIKEKINTTKRPQDTGQQAMPLDPPARE
jgi:endonuclease III